MSRVRYRTCVPVAKRLHLGGFILGVAVGLILLSCRLVNARGGDLLSGLLGRRAWVLIGKPTTEPGILQRLP